MPQRTGRPWQRRKARIIRRDSGLCHLCGRPGADTADHIVPWEQSHDDSDANLKAAHHRPCNQLRGNRSVIWAQAEIRKRWTELFNEPPPPSDTAWEW